MLQFFSRCTSFQTEQLGVVILVHHTHTCTHIHRQDCSINPFYSQVCAFNSCNIQRVQLKTGTFKSKSKMLLTSKSSSFIKPQEKGNCKKKKTQKKSQKKNTTKKVSFTEIYIDYMEIHQKSGRYTHANVQYANKQSEENALISAALALNL